jgi:hypothetical protein
MLLFRAEEDVDRWCDAWRQPRGATMTLDQQWQLARAWFSEYRGKPEWRRRTVDEAQAVFGAIGLTGPFWTLAPG